MENLLLNIIVLGLATWRISSLFVQEEGPYSIFPRIKYYIFRQKYYKRSATEDEDGRKINTVEKLKFSERFEATEIRNNNEFLTALACIWCLSIWVSFGLTLGYSLLVSPLDVFDFFVVWMGNSTVALIVNKNTK